MPISTKTELTEPVVTIRDIMPKKTVVQALAAVAGRMPPVGKNSKSPEGYNYRGIEQILEVAGPLLAAEGVVIVPFVHITGVQPVVGMKDGWTETTVSVDWDIYGPDGSKICARTVGIARDKSDKGSNKAQTQAYKYLLMPLLAIGDRDDDAEAHDTTPRPSVPPVPPVPSPVDDVMQNLRALSPEHRSDVFVALGLTGTPTAGDVRTAVMLHGIDQTMTIINNTTPQGVTQ